MEKKAFVTKAQIEEIVKKYPTPFHLYDEKGLRENCERIKRAFAWNPGYREFFEVKACPNPSIMGILKEYGFGADEGLALSDDAENPTVIPAFFTPLVAGNSRPVTFTSTYDVYDNNRTTEHPDGNLIRSRCVAVNKIDILRLFNMATLNRGYVYTIKLKIEPTYLYMLSEPDLDNPTVKIGI